VKVIWTREEDIQHERLSALLLRSSGRRIGRTGAPTAFSHRVTGSSILARWAPPAFKDGIDGDAVEGAAGP